MREVAARHFDLLVIGAGATGAGIARDAAMRGLAVALVDRGDIASGTSSRSSRLIHGGIRYLEHGHLRLVLESSRERRRMLRLAPHLVRPLEFIWPVYRGARVPRWKLRAGLWMYDALAAFRNVRRHRSLSPQAIRSAAPALRDDGLMGGASYWDASTDDARLTLAIALDAAALGAVVVTHAAVDGLDIERGSVRGAYLRDRLGGERFSVRARVTVNAAGPWSDAVRRMAGARSIAVRGSRGSHIAIPRDRARASTALTLLSPVDGRVFFVLPDGDTAVVGTTDAFTDVAPDDVRATEGDIAYLLRSVGHFFPSTPAERGDVIAAWSGVRPLMARGSSSAGASSREHAVERGETGLISVTGGKLTTWRVMAADVVDAARRALGAHIRVPAHAERPLPGGAIDSLEVETAAASRDLGDAELGSVLVAACGNEWRAVAARLRADPGLAERVTPGRPERLAQLVHAIDREMACTLGDLLIRRTRLAWGTRDHGRAAAARAAVMLAPRLSWSDRDRERALADYDAEVERIFSVSPAIS